MAESLGQALRFARKKANMTMQEVGSRLGVSHQAIGQWEKDETHPSTPNLIRVAELYGVDMGALTEGEVRSAVTRDLKTGDPIRYIDDRRQDDGGPQEFRIADVPLGSRGELARDIPVLGIAVGGDDADFQFNGEVVEYVRRPPGIVGVRSVFSLFVANDSMVPRFRPGELIYALSSRPVHVGDDVVVELKSDDTAHGGGYIKRLKKMDASRIVVEQFNPPKEIVFDRHAVKAVHRVLTTNELFGV